MSEAAAAAAVTEGPKEYRWKYFWSDQGDAIITSHQAFPCKELAQLDALKHQPTIRPCDARGRTGHPKMSIMESPVLEYRWFVTVYNDMHEPIARYNGDVWYDSWIECLNASHSVTPEVMEMDYYWDMEFESRKKQ